MHKQCAGTRINRIKMTGVEHIPSPRPRRPAVVCDQCRTRKLKCDRKLPCNRCVRAAEQRDCTYTKAPRPKHQSHTNAESPAQSFGHRTTHLAPSETSRGASADQDRSPDRVYLQKQSSGDQDRDVFPSWCYHGQGSWQSLLRRVIIPYPSSLCITKHILMQV